MDTVLRVCTPFVGKFMFIHVKNNSVVSFNSVFISTGVVCKVSSYCLDSDVEAKQKLSLQFWNQKENFNNNNPEQPVIEQEKAELSEITPQNPNSLNSDSGTKLHFSEEKNEKTVYTRLKPDSDSKYEGTKLHFLEERDEKTLSKRLVILSRSNKTRSAFELFLSMEASNLKPEFHACNSLLSSLLRNGLLKDALKVFDKMVHSEMATAHSYTIVLKALARIEGCDKAVALFEKLEQESNSKREFDIIVYNTMLSVCARGKNWVESEKLWRKLSKSSLKGTLLTYDLLISTFVQCGCAELAIEAYQELVRIGLVPNENILKAIIAVSTLEGDCELSLSLLNKMITCNIKPSLITFNSVINCLGKSGHVDLAFRVYKILQLNNLQPDVYTINALLSALYRSDRYAMAIRLFQGVKKEGKIKLNSHLYNVVLMIFRKLGFWDRAVQLLWEMERIGMEMHTESYNHVIFTCEIACEPSVALMVYQHMVQRGCKTDNFTYLPLIRCCMSGSFWTHLDQILKDIALDVSLYNVIIHEWCSQDKIELARKIHVKMLKIGFTPDEKTKSLIRKHFSK